MKRCLIGLAYAFLLSGSTEVLAEINDDPPSHCKGNSSGNFAWTAFEWTVFSCQVGEKTLSLCGFENKDSSAYKSLSYRFGRLGQAPELEYPKRPMPVWKAFRVSALDINRRPWSRGFSDGPIDKVRRDAAEHFERVTGLVLPSGSYTEVAFSSGPYTYTFYYQIAGPKTGRALAGEAENSGAGLVVEKNGQVVASLPCNNSKESIDSGADGRSFPRRVSRLNSGINAKNDFKDEALYFRGVSPLNQQFKHETSGKGE